MYSLYGLKYSNSKTLFKTLLGLYAVLTIFVVSKLLAIYLLKYEYKSWVMSWEIYSRVTTIVGVASLESFLEFLEFTDWARSCDLENTNTSY